MDKDKLEKHLRCPVCFEIPVNEIFQCKNGHQICKECCGKLPSPMCPSCRIKYGNSKIRNRAMETLLDAIEFECRFSNNGCTEKIKRIKLTSHISECKFRSFDFCKLLGFNSCKVDAKKQIARLMIMHLEKDHLVAVRQAHELVICHEDFSSVVLSPTRSDTSLAYPPVLIKLEKDNYGPTFLLLGRVKNDVSCSWTCLYMGDEIEASTFQIEFSIRNIFGNGEASELKWTSKPHPYTMLEEVLNKPSNPVPLSFFANHVCNVGNMRTERNSLTLYVRITTIAKLQPKFEHTDEPLKIRLK